MVCINFSVGDFRTADGYIISKEDVRAENR